MHTLDFPLKISSNNLKNLKRIQTWHNQPLTGRKILNKLPTATKREAVQSTMETHLNPLTALLGKQLMTVVAYTTEMHLKISTADIAR